MQLVGESFVLKCIPENLILRSLRFEKDGTLFSYQEGIERFWKIRDYCLELININGEVVSRFLYKEENWIGDRYKDSEVLENHYLLEPYSESWVNRTCTGKKLIYLIAIGDLYCAQARMLIHSIRKFGKYDGDILIFCEKAEYFRSIESPKVKVKVFDFKKQYEFGGISPKIILEREIVGSDYDRIMFLDCDILCYKPIEGLFSGNGFSFTQHLESLSGAISRKRGALDAISREEGEKRIGEKAVNGGSFCLTGKVFNAFMKEATSLLRKGRYRVFKRNDSNWVSEETAILAMLCSKNFKSDENRPFSPRDINFNWKRHSVEDEILFHYTGSADIINNFNIMVTDYFLYVSDESKCF